MTDRIPAQPGLYSLDAVAPPSLHGRKCQACGYIFFPPHPYSCEACGATADQISAYDLVGRGTLQSYATVHVYQGEDIKTPFTVGAVSLDGGPTIRAVLTCPTDEGLSLGAPMQSVFVPIGQDDSGREIVELRFEPAQPGRND